MPTQLTHYRFLVAALLLSLSPVLAEEQPAPKPAEKPAEKAAPAPAKTDPVLVLPKLEVHQSVLHKIDVELTKLDKQIAREKKNMKSTELDKALNNTQLTNAAAIFGGNSAEHLAAVAATRVSLMEAERGILEAMKLPTSQKEFDTMSKELEELRTTRRNLDKPNR